MALTPPVEGEFPTFNDGLNVWQTHALTQGFSISTSNAACKRDGEYTRYVLRCTCGNTGRKSQAKIRKSSMPSYPKCPFEGVAKLYKNTTTWRFTIKNSNHSHPPIFTTTVHRQQEITESITSIIRTGIDNLASDRTIYKAVRTAKPSTVLTENDVHNYIARAKKEEQGLYTDCGQIIRHLQENNVWHKVEYKEGRMYRLVWSFDWCKEMWKRAPEVVLLDATYKVNSFNTPFLEVTGTTSLNTNFNIAFAILPDETETSYTWVLRHLNMLRQELQIEAPAVTITDKAEAARNALRTVWPSTQLQLCLWHLMSNVRAGVKQKWKGPVPSGYVPLKVTQLTALKEGYIQKPTKMSEERFEALRSTPPPLTLLERNNEAYRRQRRERLSLPQIDHDINGLLSLWGYLAHCKTEAECVHHWADICSEFADQPSILTYLKHTYWQHRQQWAWCYVRTYCNFGIRSTSRVESGHAELKSYLISPHCTGLHLYKATTSLTETKRDRFFKQADHQTRRFPVLCQANMFANRGVKLIISWYALEKAYEQYKIAWTAHSRNQSLHPCTGCFEKCMGIPCRHSLYKRLYSEEKEGRERGKRIVHLGKGMELNIQDFHTHWWLQVDLTQIDPVLLVGDIEAQRKRNKPSYSVHDRPVPKRPRPIPGSQTPASYFQHSDSQRLPSWHESVLEEGPGAPQYQQQSRQISPPPVFRNPTSEPWYHDLQILGITGIGSQDNPLDIPSTPSHLSNASSSASLINSPTAPTQPLTSPIQTSELSALTWDDPRAIYDRYLLAREEWYKTQPCEARNNQAYRQAKGLPLHYNKASYQWCLDFKQMTKHCQTRTGTREWTMEEMMAYLDWDKAQEDRVNERVALTTGNALSNRRGMTGLMRMAEQDWAEQQALYLGNHSA